jgi:hypothetical protein
LKYGEQKRIDVKGFDVFLDMEFAPTKIQDLIREFVQAMDFVLSKGVKFSEFPFNDYLNILVIRHFSSINIPNQIGVQLDILEKMINNDLLDQIILSFNRNQLERVSEEMIGMTERISEVVDKLDKEGKLQEIENFDVLVKNALFE